MVDLVSRTPCADLLPFRIGDATLDEADPGRLTSLSPYKGRRERLSEVLADKHGLGFPAPNRTISAGDSRILWFGRDTALLAGVVPDKSLARHAALTDQSDAWAAVEMRGLGAEDVLARLVPVDLRSGSFPREATCRTLVGHMSASVTRLTDDGFLILVFRSMAQTLVDELHEAMEAVAARR